MALVNEVPVPSEEPSTPAPRVQLPPLGDGQTRDSGFILTDWTGLPAQMRTEKPAGEMKKGYHHYQKARTARSRWLDMGAKGPRNPLNNDPRKQPSMRVHPRDTNYMYRLHLRMASEMKKGN